MCVHAIVLVQRSENNQWELVVSFYRVGRGTELRLSGKAVSTLPAEPPLTGPDVSKNLTNIE